MKFWLASDDTGDERLRYLLVVAFGVLAMRVFFVIVLVAVGIFLNEWRDMDDGISGSWSGGRVVRRGRVIVAVVETANRLRLVLTVMSSTLCFHSFSLVV